MARDRQRAKQRQAERRARREREGERAPGAPRPDATPADGDGDAPRRRGRARERGGTAPPGIESETGADLAAGAPPEAIGRSDTALETPPPPSFDPDDEYDGQPPRERADDAGAGTGATDGRNRVIAFLIASWAELKRVQWPTRQQTTTLTGIVLGFVVIMGAYLGALDAVFSRLIQLVI